MILPLEHQLKSNQTFNIGKEPGVNGC